MNSSATEQPKQPTTYDLLKSLKLGNWLKLPCKVMRECGPATQTLAGIFAITNRETFVEVREIAEHAMLPIETVRNHLTKLAASGYIENKGRQRMPGRMARRTCTIAITSKTRNALRTDMETDDLLYGVLPKWACGTLIYDEEVHMPWSAKAVLSVVMARLMSLASVVKNLEGGNADHLTAEEMWGSIENLGHVDDLGHSDRFRFPLVGFNGKGLLHSTGLSKGGIEHGKLWLEVAGIIEWRDGIGERSKSQHVAAMLIPSQSFKVAAEIATLPDNDLRIVGAGQSRTSSDKVRQVCFPKTDHRPFPKTDHWLS